LDFLTLNTFHKKEFIFIFFLLLNLSLSNEIYASKKRSIISGIEVKVYKKEKKHLETSALLCALAINGKSLDEIKRSLETNFKNPISNIFPNLELVLFNLFETLEDIFLFFKNLIL